MEKLLLITGALMVGGIFGFFLAACLSMGRAPHPDPLPEGEGKVGAGFKPAPTRPEALAAEPEEIVAVYEARREMGERIKREAKDDLVMVDCFPMTRKALKGWEKEQDKREKRRVR